MKETNTTTPKNVLLYDWIRLIATITVVIGHSCFLSIYSPLGSMSYSLPSEIGNIWFSPAFKFWEFLSTWVYSFHMPLFFFLSGAVLDLKPLENFKKIIYKKAKHLLIPFLLTGFVFFLPILFLLDYYSSKKVPDVIFNFLLGFESGYLWFLPALFWTTLCFSILMLFINKFVKNNYLFC